jgi:hypothetical protein
VARTTSTLGIRDSKHPHAVTLGFTADAADVFLQAVSDGRLNH